MSIDFFFFSIWDYIIRLFEKKIPQVFYFANLSISLWHSVGCTVSWCWLYVHKRVIFRIATGPYITGSDTDIGQAGQSTLDYPRRHKYFSVLKNPSQNSKRERKIQVKTHIKWKNTSQTHKTRKKIQVKLI